MDDLLEPVGDLLRFTARTVVLPKFRAPGTPTFEKGPGDWVTAADLESEALLSARLAELLPGSTVVGEEAVHADRSVLNRLGGQDPVWVIDPVDGTANFAAGREPFAIIVALARAGATTHGWIYLPLEDRMLLASPGHGVRIGGTPPPEAAPPDRLRGIVPLHAVPDHAAESIRQHHEDGAIELLPTLGCAGAEYPSVLTGRSDFVFFTGSMPWDHAAGALALTECGGVAAYLDGETYTVLDEARRPLLIARTPEIWDAVRADVLDSLA